MIQRQQLQNSVLLAERHVTKHYLKQAFVGSNHFCHKLGLFWCHKACHADFDVRVCNTDVCCLLELTTISAATVPLLKCVLGPSYL